MAAVMVVVLVAVGGGGAVKEAAEFDVHLPVFFIFLFFLFYPLTGLDRP